MANVFSAGRGAVRTYRPKVVTAGLIDDTAGGTYFVDVVTIDANVLRLRVQNSGAVDLWINWNAAPVANQCIKLAAGDTIDLEQEYSDLVLWMGITASGSTTISVLPEY